jgi:hypothetical protein
VLGAEDVKVNTKNFNTNNTLFNVETHCYGIYDSQCYKKGSKCQVRMNEEI